MKASNLALTYKYFLVSISDNPKIELVFTDLIGGNFYEVRRKYGNINNPQDNYCYYYVFGVLMFNMF